MRRMKCGGWYEQFHGDAASAARIAVRMYPDLKPDWYSTHFTVLGDGTAKFVTPAGNLLRIESGWFVACRHESGVHSYHAVQHVPPDWLEPNDDMTPFTRTIMKDWMNFR